MEMAGARVRTFEAADVPGFFTHALCCGPDRSYAGRPTVIGELGPEQAPALLVLAHSDVVPINNERERWSLDPFQAVVRDGRVYGRGASDDKWGVAGLLVIMQELAAAQACRDKRLVFATTIDEESGVGNGTLLLSLAGLTAQAALYLDGNDTFICIGNLGGSTLFLGPDGTVSPEDRRRHAEALGALCERLSRERSGLFDRPFLADNEVRHRSFQFRERAAPGDPRMTIAFYTVGGEEPGDVMQGLEGELSAALGDDLAHYTLEYRLPWFEPVVLDPRLPLVQHLQAAYRSEFAREPVVTTISKQDAFVLTRYAGIPTVSFGAGHKSGPGAGHQPDEFVEIDTAWRVIRTAERAIRAWLAS
jgi:acetylornithine deacetylase/succinyl-diaminopimelate desuccinylase-like protein